MVTFCIIITIIMGFLFIFEHIYSLSAESKWKKYDEIVEKMNEEKLSNDCWEAESLVWIYKDEEIKPKSNKKRILVVGDSYVWGSGYANANHIWWQQLRNKLLENGYNDVEIMAMGISGYNTYQEYQMLLNENICLKCRVDIRILFNLLLENNMKNKK